MEVDKVKVLIVEDDQGLAELLQEEVIDMGYAARYVVAAEDAVTTVAEWKPDIVVSDLRLPGADGIELLQTVRHQHGNTAPDFVIVTAFGSVAKAVESLKAGAEDFLIKPIDLEHLKVSITRILERRNLRRQFLEMKSIMMEESTFHGMYGRSQAMLNLFQQIRQLAKAAGPVLITGESGTGKELVARAIHAENKREARPFLAVNCAGIPKDLLESEFFGHESGAFTGAGQSRRGIFEEAEGGTLLLDEISEMPLSLQAKLLRVLQDGKIRPVGCNHERQVNVRILAATNRNLEELVGSEDFREDLFYRLDTFQLKIPPLRERAADIDLLAGIFLNKYAAVSNKKIDGFSPQAFDLLHDYGFPGNVRELQNAIERAVVFCNEKTVKPEHFPARMLKQVQPADPQQISRLLASSADGKSSLLSLDDVEKIYIRHVLEKVGGNKKLAADKLGIARRTLYRKLEE